MGGFLIQRFGYNTSFLGLSAVGLVAFLVLFGFFPETPAQSELIPCPKERLATP